jgi:hypothetical protein
VPVVFGVILYLVVWIIQGFTKESPPSAATFDLRELRQNLAEAQTADSKGYQEGLAELEPYLNQLEASTGTMSL